MKLTCPVVEDLLPFYHDKTCSGESQRLIEEHLVECRPCRSILSGYQEIIPYAGRQAKPVFLQTVETCVGKKQKRNFRNGIKTVLVIIGLLFVLFLIVNSWFEIPVSSEDIQISETSQLENGDIIFHFYIDDNYEYSFGRITIRDDGSVYDVPCRRLLGERRTPDFHALHDTYRVIRFDFEEMKTDNGRAFLPEDLSAVYVGSPNDPVLVWEKGQELPPASEKLEEIAKDIGMTIP